MRTVLGVLAIMVPLLIVAELMRRSDPEDWWKGLLFALVFAAISVACIGLGVWLITGHL